MPGVKQMSLVTLSNTLKRLKLIPITANQNDIEKTQQKNYCVCQKFKNIFADRLKCRTFSNIYEYIIPIDWFVWH